MEGFQNPFRRLAPISSDGPSAISSSDYQESRFNATASFDAYKRPTMVRSPRGNTTVVTMAPETLSASQFLRQKYGDFSGAVDVVPSVIRKAPPQTQIMGLDSITVGDLKLLQDVIDMELLRLANTRSVATAVTVRKGQLEFLAENVANVLGAVEREEVKIEEVAIFPANARVFLKTFRTSESLPELFDPEGNSPASIGLFPSVETPSLSPPSIPNTPTSQQNQLPWFFQNIQKLKWSIEADYLVEQAKQKEMKRDVKEMEERIMGYSYTDTPMPEGYRKLFLAKIRSIEKELIRSPE